MITQAEDGQANCVIHASFAIAYRYCCAATTLQGTAIALGLLLSHLLQQARHYNSAPSEPQQSQC